MNKFTHKRFIGYTLVEVLVVVSVILILAGISFGTASGVQAARMKSIAKAEIALIVQSLSNFNNHFGEYPITEGEEDNALTLSKALLGWKVFSRNASQMVDRKVIPDGGIKTFIELSKILHDGDSSSLDDVMPSNVRFIDPWGNAYVYAYKESSEWDNYSYVLYSKGPDGADTKFELDGIIDYKLKNLENNIDNIYIED